jgi:hypothetical protein
MGDKNKQDSGKQCWGLVARHAADEDVPQTSFRIQLVDS